MLVLYARLNLNSIAQDVQSMKDQECALTSLDVCARPAVVKVDREDLPSNRSRQERQEALAVFQLRNCGRRDNSAVIPQ